MQTIRLQVRFVWPLSVLLSLCFCGCSQDERPLGVPVSGVVLLNGNPVEGADVAFSSREGSTGAFGVTDAQGRFQLSALETREGIPPGEYQVKITKVGVESEWHPDWD